MLYQQIAQNKRKTVLVVFLFTLILAAAGAGIGFMVNNNWWMGIIIALVVTGIYLAIVLHNPANLVMSLNHAQEVHEKDHPELIHIVQDMAMVARVPMPKVYIIDDPSPNAFATGRDPEHASVAVTSGLLKMMNREELEGVLGHELSHIKNYDILLSTVSIVLVAVITYISGFAARFLFWNGGRDNDDDNSNNAVIQIIKIVLYIFTIILAPLAATLAQLALSRNREYLADASSVYLTRDPQGLISALKKIQNAQPMKNVDPSSTALYIEDPLHQKSGWSHLFDTHPPTADRIKRLEKM